MLEVFMGGLGANAMYTGTYGRGPAGPSGFWARPPKEEIVEFNSKQFRCEFDAYIEEKRKEDRPWKITWFNDKIWAQIKIYNILNQYEQTGSEYFRNKLAEKIYNTASEFCGWKYQVDNSNGSGMSRMLMKWYHSLKNGEPVKAQVVSSVPTPVPIPSRS